MKLSSDPGQFRRLAPISAAIVMLLAGCGGSSSGCSAAKGSSAHAVGRNYNLPLRVQMLQINNAAGCTQVTGTPGSSQIHVVERPTGKATSDHNVYGSTATLGSHCPAGINFSDCHMDYQVTMPSSIALNVRGGTGCHPKGRTRQRPDPNKRRGCDRHQAWQWLIHRNGR